jgi:hypothetical protein
MDDALPQSAWTACILVLIYSAICLCSSILLASMLIANGEKTNCEAWLVDRLQDLLLIAPPDITLIALVVGASSTASIIQQIYYACHWRTIKRIAWEQAKLSITHPTIAYGPLSTGWNLGLYEFQLVCYTINALLILCWAVALMKGVYNWRYRRLMGWESYISNTSKILAFSLPPMFIGLSFLPSMRDNANGFLAMNIVLSKPPETAPTHDKLTHPTSPHKLRPRQYPHDRHPDPLHP